MEGAINTAAMRALGASVTPMAIGELYTALQMGVVEGQENPLNTIYAHKYYEVQKYVSMTGHMTQHLVLCVSETFFQGLSPEMKALLIKAAQDAGDYQSALQLKANAHKDGYAQWKSTFDERGNETSTSCFGADGKPCLQNGGYAGWKATYDERGNRHASPSSALTASPAWLKTEFAEVVRTYDERGNKTSESFFGVDGKPCWFKDGYARWLAQFDQRGNQTGAFYFGADGKPCLGKDGFAGMVCVFDERGNRTSQSYFGTDGKPCLHKEGNAGWKVHLRRTGKQDKLCPTSAPTASPACKRTGTPNGGPSLTNAETGQACPISAPTASPA